MSQKYRCLISKNHLVSLFNVRLNNESLKCGAAVFFGKFTKPVILFDLDNKQEICTIEIPEEITKLKSETHTRLTSQANNIKIMLTNRP